jgi:protein tyrosine phosphatase (PTP) superfamily phosphohydrolase (DUF442 family)
LTVPPAVPETPSLRVPSPDSNAPGARLAAPDFTSPSSTAEPPLADSKTDTRKPSPPLPVGIPQFAQARDGVANGLRPLLEDGLDWLQSNGYRTILHVRQPGEDDAADRRQVEKRGLQYLTIEVTPQTLARAQVEAFNRIVGDKANYPLFVYDKDGMLAGGLWYLHFRTEGQESDEIARARSARLGLKADANGEHRPMWLALQKYLSEMNK